MYLTANRSLILRTSLLPFGIIPVRCIPAVQEYLDSSVLIYRALGPASLKGALEAWEALTQDPDYEKYQFAPTIIFNPNPTLGSRRS